MTALRGRRLFVSTLEGAATIRGRCAGIFQLGSVSQAALERDRSVRKRIAASLTYPGIVAGATLGVIGLLLTTTVPMFRGMYAQLHIAVPPVLNALIGFSAILQSAGFWLTLALAVFGA